MVDKPHPGHSQYHTSYLDDSRETEEYDVSDSESRSDHMPLYRDQGYDKGWDGKHKGEDKGGSPLENGPPMTDTRETTVSRADMS